MSKLRSQALRFGADLRVAKVLRADLSAPAVPAVGRRRIDQPDLTADAVIVATGARSLPLSVPGEDRLLGHGLSTCATCDGFFFRGQEIAVVGGGDSALEEALFLTRFATKVTVIHRRDQLRASRIMQERALAHEEDRVPLEHLSSPRCWTAEESVHSLAVRDTVTGDEGSLAVTGVFVAIGHVPNTSLVEGQLDLDENGYVVTSVGPGHVHRGRLRRGRRPGPRVPPGHHLGRLGLHGGDRRGALARGAGPLAGPGTSRGPAALLAFARTEEPMATIQTLTDATFKETVIGAETPILVDFWAEWCGPCKQIAPVLEEIASEQEGRLSIGKLNVDDNLGTAQEYSVMSIPTLILFKGGEPVARLVGAKPKGALLQELSAYL